MIPCTRNHAGFPDGISGTELLERMREQAQQYGARIETEFVTRLERDEKAAVHRDLGLGLGRRAQTVLLATGVTNRRPPMDEELHDDALARGLIRYCPICDGYEVTDKKVGVIGSDSHGVAEALFLRSYTADVTLIAPDKALQLERRGPGEARRTRGSTASTARRRRSRSPTTASSSTPPRAITPSTASIRRSARTRTRQLAEMVGARPQRATAASGSTPPAHQRPRPLCGGRRGHRPRPDQPCDGRRRRRRDHHPQRSGEATRADAARR